MQMNRKTLLLSLRVETVASHPVQDIYYNRSCRCSTGNLMSFELTAMKLILKWYFFFSFGFVIDCQENRYGLKGSSIQLSISPRNQSHQQDELNELKNVKWRRFNRRDFLGDKDGVPPGFKKKISLNNSDWSLSIHNLQEDDGGLYEALSKHEDEILAAFTLIVENTVSKPIIKVNQYDFNSSAACRATVNCSADGSWATYDCDQNFCAAAQASQSSINITVTALDSSGIKCNAKNHVSKNHSTAPNIRCREKQQSDFRYSPPLIVWIIVTVIGGVFLGLVMGVIVVFVKRRKCSKVHPQSSRVVIEQHHETIYCTVEKPAAPQTSPVNNAASNKVETIYDTPSRHTKACQVDSVEVMRDKQEQQQSGQDSTIQVKATVHQAAEPDSDPINTVYCKLGEI